MNIFDLDGKQMDDLASEYLTGMYESQYDDTNNDQADIKPHVKALTKEEIQQINEDIPFWKDLVPPTIGGEEIYENKNK